MLKECQQCHRSSSEHDAKCPHCGHPLGVGASALAPSMSAADDATRTWAGASSAIVDDVPRIPGYEILDKLGQGGMGIVYRARQLSLNRLVALKMLRDATDHRASFRREAELLAHVRHPNFVQIFDFGVCAGRPYIAMELLEGGPVPARHALWDPRKAAALLGTLARAIHVAHTLGIVHRDLKPGNVLLTSDGAPKISDFGLAQRVEDLAKEPAVIAGTARYMAPEQAEARAEDIGPATDVYALGSMLYEMLTGQTPRERTWATGQARDFGEGPLPVPRPCAVRNEIPRDLDAICMKCLARRPGDRYASAAALADDLDRFREGLPVAARPAGRCERLGKWMRRRPALAGLATLSIAVVALASVLGPAFALHQRQRADVERQLRVDSQRSLADALSALRALVDVAMTLDDQPGMRDARARILQEALAKYDQMLERYGEDPDMLDELGRTCLAWGDVAGELGHYDKAHAAFERALDICAKQGTERVAPRENLIRVHDRLAHVHFARRDMDKAEAAHREAVEHARALHQDTGAHGALLAKVLNNLSEFLRLRNRPAEILPLLIEAHKAIASTPLPHSVEHLASLAQIENNIGAAYYAEKKLDIAAPWFEKALKNRERLVERQPDSVRYRKQLAESYANLGIFERRRGNLAAGRRHHESAFKLLERLALAYPKELIYFQRLARNHTSLGIVCYDLKDFEAAGQWFGKAVEVRRHLVRDYPGQSEFRYDLAFSLKNLGKFYVDRERSKDAVTVLEEGREVLLPLLKAEPNNAEYQTKLREIDELLKNARTP